MSNCCIVVTWHAPTRERSDFFAWCAESWTGGTRIIVEDRSTYSYLTGSDDVRLELSVGSHPAALSCGGSLACELGAEYLFFINEDVVLYDNCVKNLVRTMQEWNLQIAVPSYTQGPVLNRPPISDPMPYPFITRGSHIAFTRECWARVRPWRDLAGGHCLADNDMQARCTQLGIQPYLVPSAHLHHFAEVTVNPSDLVVQANYMKSRSKFRKLYGVDGGWITLHENVSKIPRHYSKTGTPPGCPAGWMPNLPELKSRFDELNGLTTNQKSGISCETVPATDRESQ